MLPPDAVLLASSPTCPVQMFRVRAEPLRHAVPPRARPRRASSRASACTGTTATSSRGSTTRWSPGCAAPTSGRHRASWRRSSGATGGTEVLPPPRTLSRASFPDLVGLEGLTGPRCPGAHLEVGLIAPRPDHTTEGDQPEPATPAEPVGPGLVRPAPPSPRRAATSARGHRCHRCTHGVSAPVTNESEPKTSHHSRCRPRSREHRCRRIAHHRRRRTARRRPRRYSVPPAPASGGAYNPTGSVAQYGAVPGDSDKSFVVTWLFATFLGYFGVDRFYLGKIGTGVLKLAVLGGCGIWVLVGILVLVGAQRDKVGRRLAGYEQHKKTAWIVTGVLLVVGRSRVRSTARTRRTPSLTTPRTNPRSRLLRWSRRTQPTRLPPFRTRRSPNRRRPSSPGPTRHSAHSHRSPRPASATTWSHSLRAPRPGS